MPKARNHRGGGRAARLRAGDTSDNETRNEAKGLESGAFNSLTSVEMQSIHSAALDILENVGFADAPQSTIEYLTSAGCWISDHGRVCFPRSLVEDTIANARKNLTIFGQDPKHDIDASSSKAYYSTGCGSVKVVDPEERTVRPVTTRDIYDFARLTDTLDNIHMFHRLGIPTEIEDTDDVDINLCYAAVRGTSKPVSSSWFNGENVSRSIEMMHMIAGGEDKWRARPFVINTCTFVVSPLKFSPEACVGLEHSVRGGMPVQVTSSGQQGATAPVSIGGTIVQTMAEVLCGLVYACQVSPDARVILGTWPMVSDLRTGAATTGSPEQGLLSSASCQMARFYGLPNGSISGVSDSKLPDIQCGLEKGLQHTLVGNSGGNILFCSAGALAGGLGCSHAELVIDNEIIGAALRTVKGFDISHHELAVDTIRKICLDGPGHYLGHTETLARMKGDFFYPEVSDRSSLNDWTESGTPSMVENAQKFVEDRLNSHFPTHINVETDERLHEKYRLFLEPVASIASIEFD